MKAWKFALVAIVVIFGMTVFVACGDEDEDDNGGGETTNAAWPDITVQPVGGAYLPGATVTPLSVTATITDSGTLSYQWYSTTNSLTASGGTAISNETNASFTPSTTTEGTAYYYVEVTNTNNNVNGTKTGMARSKLVKVVTGWDKVNIQQLSNNDYKAVAFGDNRFVAVGEYGKIAWSDNGVDWTIVETSTFSNTYINGIAYGNNCFIAVGASGKMASSTDGKTWTTMDASTVFGTSSINDIAYGNSRFYAVGDSAKRGYLTDSESSWTASTDSGTSTAFGSGAPSSTFINRIVYGDEIKRFMALYFASGSRYASYNTLGEDSWYGNSITDWTGAINDIIYANNYFVAAGSNGNIRKSTIGGASWTDIKPSNIETGSIFRLAYGSGKLLALSSSDSGKSVWTGDDGATWTEIPYVSCSGIVYGNGCFVAVGSSGIWYAVYP